jgi:hypothetical protein
MLFAAFSVVYAECPLDHFIIGVNEDGVEGNEDDCKLFVDCSQKYRNTGSTSYKKWYYPNRHLPTIRAVYIDF